MTLTQLLVFSSLALLAAPFSNSQRRGWGLMIASITALYWLQPSTPIRNLDFWLPTATMAITVLVWTVTRQADEHQQNNQVTGLILLLFILAIGATRFLPFHITPSRPPQLLQVTLALGILGALVILLSRVKKGRPLLQMISMLGLLLIFILLKNQPLAESLSAVLRRFTGQTTALASAFDIRWLGFSYVSFRLLHTLRDRLSGRLPQFNLRDFITYIIFFPTITAGPIDRIQRFRDDLEKDFRLDTALTLEGLKRITIGVLMKFVLADSLALIALDPSNVFQTPTAAWMWVLVYAFSLRIFFDFAGYTHIALGMALLLGFKLPENFDRPYLKTNLTSFWNSWHMTLAQWFRAYYFNPLTRWLRGRGSSAAAIILVGQFSTMVLIGLWHGITWNFLIWGMWHGLGLFLHNRWVAFTKTRSQIPNPQIAQIGGTLVTFHFVALGWVWFALPEPEQSLYVLQTLLGWNS